MASFATSLLSALPVGNPADASLYTNGVCSGGSVCDPCDPHFSWNDQFQGRIGFYGDYVFNRQMTIKGRGNVRETSLKTNAGLMVVNLCNFIDVFWTLGGTTMNLVANGGEFSSDSTLIEIQFEPYFSWSVGGRATICKFGNLYGGVETQFFRTRPDIDNIIRYASGDITYLSIDNKAVYEEWQVGLGLTYKMGWMAPYIAAKASTGKLKMGDYLFVFQGTGITYQLRDLVPRHVWGYVVGTTFAIGETVGLTLEGRFANELALYVNGEIRF
ncbi:MAG: Major outer membrane porin [Chlamydiales bacterium]|nr:Major outer membrane porin [Chlamydiales bacterium]